MGIRNDAVLEPPPVRRAGVGPEGGELAGLPPPIFGGVPRRVTIDNAKCAITWACRHDPTVQRSYAEVAEGYGFKIDACPPREPKKKGRVEAGVKYVKRNFMPLRDFRGLADGNRQLETWVLETAGNRIHGTTRERPLARFAETERHLLQSLPSVAPEPAVWARVKLASNCHVQFELCCQKMVPGATKSSATAVGATATLWVGRLCGWRGSL